MSWETSLHCSDTLSNEGMGGTFRGYKFQCDLEACEGFT